MINIANINENDRKALFQAMAAAMKANNIPLHQTEVDERTFEQSANTEMDIDFLSNFIQKNIRMGHFSLNNRNLLYISFWEEIR